METSAGEEYYYRCGSFALTHRALLLTLTLTLTLILTLTLTLTLTLLLLSLLLLYSILHYIIF